MVWNDRGKVWIWVVLIILIIVAVALIWYALKTHRSILPEGKPLPSPASSQTSAPPQASGDKIRRAPPSEGEHPERSVRKMRFSSIAFADIGMMQPKYTADGEDIIPPLRISDVPEGAKSLVIIMDDPDAPGGVWDHWVLYSIPPEIKEVEEGKEPAGAVQGKNSWGKTGYRGPAPPSGTHRYIFKLYALDAKLDLKPGARKHEVEAAMKGHILAEASFMGKYARKR